MRLSPNSTSKDDLSRLFAQRRELFGAERFPIGPAGMDEAFADQRFAFTEHDVSGDSPTVW